MSGQKTRHQKLNSYLVMNSLGDKNLISRGHSEIRVLGRHSFDKKHTKPVSIYESLVLTFRKINEFLPCPSN